MTLPDIIETLNAADSPAQFKELLARSSVSATGPASPIDSLTKSIRSSSASSSASVNLRSGSSFFDPIRKLYDLEAPE